MQTHTILGGKVQLFKRGQVWFARASVNKQQIKKSTGSDSLSLAQQVAEGWYVKSHSNPTPFRVQHSLLRHRL